jgi:NAD(P)-dependent dehydrogenase (short-subunit alcohol dehydrogenase family)
MDSLTGKLVVITGTSQGIGAATAAEFTRRGAVVVGLTLDPNPSAPHREIGVDITDAAATDRALADIRSEFGPLDVLVNNAGRHPSPQLIDTVGDDDLRDLLELNVVAAFRLIRLVLPGLRARRGSIVNIGSSSGLYGQDGSVAYSATKGALSAMTKALAIDEGPWGVRVNCVCPGAIASPATDLEHTPAVQESIARWSVLGRLGTTDEVARTIAYLASDDAAYITGHDLVVSGGANVGYGERAYQTIGHR